MKKEQEKKLPNQARLWPLPQEVPLLTVKENLGSQGKLGQIYSNEMKYVNETYQRFMKHFGLHIFKSLAYIIKRTTSVSQQVYWTNVLVYRIDV